MLTNEPQCDCPRDSCNPIPAGNARNSLQIGDKVNSLKTSFLEQRSDRPGLPVADLHQQKPSRLQHSKGRGDQTANHIETICAREQRQRRLMFAHFNGKRITIARGHIGRVGNYHVKPFVRNRREQIAM